jgi:hypothetical protein
MGIFGVGTIAAGTPHPQAPGCLWDPALGDYACDDGYTYAGVALPPNYQFPNTGVWAGLTGGASGDRRVSISGRTYILPANVEFPPDGWYVWSLGYSEQWLISVGATPVGQAPLTPQQVSALVTPLPEGRIEQYQREQEALNAQAGTPDALSALVAAAKKTARAGGADAEAALQFLSDNGDWFAWLALSLGIGYTVATILPFAGGGLALLMVLKK